MAQMPEFLCHMLGKPRWPGVLGGLAQPWLLWEFGCKTVDGRFFFLFWNPSLSFFLTLSLSLSLYLLNTLISLEKKLGQKYTTILFRYWTAGSLGL